jgi:hypothetical protein
MRTLSRLLKASLIPALLACALTLPPAPASSAQTDNRGLDIVKIRAEDGQEIKLYDKSYALVIGVSDYTAGWPKLPGVKQDVEAVARALERQGFQVTTVLNPDSAELDKSFKTFIDQYGLNVENRLLFYFAGHGHTIKQSYGDEMGYIVPVDAPNPLRDRPGFMSKAMDMQQMELYARRIQSKHALFVFDSCFSGSIFALSRAVPESIGYKTARPVRQFITSGSADEQVPDKSIFREQFIAAIEGEADTNRDGYVTGTELGEFLQDKVVNYSRNTQHPQYGKIRNPNLDKGDFVFALPKATKQPPAVAAANTNPTPAQPTSPSTVDPAAVELAFWDSIKNSTDAEDFKDYLSKYPNGQFASIARRRVAALSEAARPVNTQPVPVQPSGGSAANMAGAVNVNNMISRFTSGETESKDALIKYTFKRDVVVQTIGDDGRVTGEYHRTSSFVFDDSGTSFEKILFFPAPTIAEITISAEDLKYFGGNAFALESSKINDYNFAYVGKENIDGLNTYAFDVTPKILSDPARLETLKKEGVYFQGRVWVDDQDFHIVKMRGKGVPEIKQRFPIVETYRKQIDGKYWFPSYTYADDELKFNNGQTIHIRVSVRFSEFMKSR